MLRLSCVIARAHRESYVIGEQSSAAGCVNQTMDGKWTRLRGTAQSWFVRMRLWRFRFYGEFTEHAVEHWACGRGLNSWWSSSRLPPPPVAKNNSNPSISTLAFVAAAMNIVCSTTVGTRLHWSTGSRPDWVGWDGMASAVDGRCDQAI